MPRIRNKQKEREYSAKWRATNPERVLETARKWRAGHRLQSHANAKKWREENRERHLERNKIRNKTKQKELREWRVKNWSRELKKGRARRLAKFGLTLLDHAAMKKNQGYKCEICKKRKPLAVDHCHISGKVRALLCHHCNRTLGIYEIEKARGAFDAYVNRFSALT